MSTDPFDKAKASLGEAWKAARIAAGDVKREIERAGIAKSLDDAGREIARAATSVANHLGAELEDLGREIRIKAEAHLPPDPTISGTPGETPTGQPQAAQSTQAQPHAAPASPAQPHAPPSQAHATPPGPTHATPAGYPIGEAYAPDPGPGPAQAPPEPAKEPGGFRIAADDDRRS